MKWQMRLIAINLSALIWVGCSEAQKKADAQAYELKAQIVLAHYNQANKLLDDGKFDEAAKAYDAIQLNDPIGPLDLLVVFNAGVAYYSEGQCEVAGEKYRSVIRMAKKNSPEIKGQALLQMGDVYTCLGQDNKTITNLVELSQGEYRLPPEILLTEIPARLAGAYARIGNIREAEKFYRAAEKGLIRLSESMQKRRDRGTEMARILLMMGGVTQLKTDTLKSDDYLSTLRALQKYLYKAVELNAKDSSVAAAEQLSKAYDDVWTYIDTVRVEVGNKTTTKNQQLINSRETKREQLRIAELAIQNLKALYRERTPDPDEVPLIGAFIGKMHDQEMKFRNFIATNLVGTELTPEALEAEGLKRVGRVLNPDPILEEKALIREKTPQPKPKVRSSRSDGT